MSDGRYFWIASRKVCQAAEQAATATGVEAILPIQFLMRP
jgi:hypothetical protein